MRRPQPWWDLELEPNLAAEFGLFLDHVSAHDSAVKRDAEILAAGTGTEAAIADWGGFIQGVNERLLTPSRLGPRIMAW